MKKPYFSPMIDASVVTTDSFIAASITVNGEFAEIELDDETYQGSFKARQQNDVWEENEAEEY